MLCWYAAYPLSDRHLDEMMEERSVIIDHSRQSINGRCDFCRYWKKPPARVQPASHQHVQCIGNSSQYAGKEIFEIHPVILGGSPIDPANKTALTREQHIDAVSYWNNQIRQQPVVLAERFDFEFIL